MDPSDGVYSLGMDLARSLRRIAIEDVGLSLKSGTLVVLAVGKGADYLLIAKPVAFNQLGIRYDCATFV